MLHGLSLVVVSRAYLLVAVHGLLLVLACYVAERGLQVRGLQQFVRGLSSCSAEAPECAHSRYGLWA